MATSIEDVSEFLIERVRQYATSPNENIEQLRSVAARLHSRSTSQDKIVREKTLERISKGNNNEFISLLISTMEIIRDPMTTASLAGIIHECVSTKGTDLEGKNRKAAIAQLIAQNATQSLVRLVMHYQCTDGQLSDTLLLECTWVLAQLSQKDPKFAAKLRLIGAVKTFHSLLRMYFNNTKIIFPLLLVIKSLAKNANTVQAMLKDNILSTLEKVLISIGLTPSPKLRIILNIINLISKNKTGQTRILKTGNLISLLLKIFERWERYDGKARLKICVYIISTLHKLILMRTGRSAILNQGGLHILYKFCSNCPDDKAYDASLSQACTIIGHCIDKLILPLDHTRNPAKFNLSPNSSNCTLIDQTETLKNLNIMRDSTPESDDEESTPDDDNIMEDNIGEDQSEALRNKSNNFFPLVPEMRDIEDLKHSYTQHFIEMNVNNDIYLQEINNKSKEIQSNNEEINSPRFKPLSGEYIIRSCKYGNIIPNPGESMIKDLPAIQGLGLSSSRKLVYNQIASRVSSVIPLVKVAFPDMVGSPSLAQPETLNIKDRRVCRSKLLRSIDRGLHPGLLLQKIVYDIDQLINTNTSPENEAKEENQQEKTYTYLTNKDLEYITTNPIYFGGPLQFESRFESGNLRKAIQVTVSVNEYDLILMPDINSSKHHQWFYFEVTNMEANKPYTFNIVNCEKHTSQFNYGMRPVMFSVLEWQKNKTGWVRAGTDICYFRNCYTSPGNKRRIYLTATFTITFPYTSDVVYIAYHYPHTYSQLLTHLYNWTTQIDSSMIIFRTESLGLTLNNNDIPLITITAPNIKSNPIESREIIFLSSRVHPGESNSSWVMHGTLMNLLSNSSTACWLRSTYVFKIVPMLNPEGVINGCYRCGLLDEDLNRRWSQPNKILQPEIYHTKGIIQYGVRVLNKVPYVYCDFHGHSRRKNVFLYGCSNAGSWWEVDKETADNPVDYLMLPNLLQHLAPAFAMHLSCFKVEKTRESTARVCLWREFKIKRSYTMETSYCGFDQGRYDGLQINTWHLQEMGSHFCQALACLRDETSWRMNMISKNIHDPRYDLNTPQSILPPKEDDSSDSDTSDMNLD